MEKYIGIICAMDEEVAHYIDELSEGRTQTIAGSVFHTGRIRGKRVVIVKSGAGKVNAGACAQLMMVRFPLSALIMTGVAGGLNPTLNTHDIVISKDSLQHDIDAKELGYERGRVPFSDLKHFTADPLLRAAARKAADKHQLKAIEGRVLSGDRFVSGVKEAEAIRKEFDGDCVDMESAAVAQVCTINKVPHLLIRSISDKADESASTDFAAMLKTAAKNSHRLVSETIAMLDLQVDRTHEPAIKSLIRTVPDWPKKGVQFRDITTLLKDPAGFRRTIDVLADRYAEGSLRPDIIVGIDARGFILGAALADRLGIGFVPIRKKGKLPAKTESEEYELEYGKDRIEIHSDAIAPGARVLIVDDLIATGGTALAACKLVERLGGKIIECCFVVDLPALGGKKKLQASGYKAYHIVDFEGD